MNSVARISKKAPRKRSEPYTFDDFCAIVPDGQKADLLGGVIYMASPDNTNAGTLFTWLFTLLENFNERTDAGKIYGQRIAFRLSDEHGPEPDIAFVKSSRLHLVRRGFVDGPPDIAIEIVSPDSAERDYETKSVAYEEAGVGEYWIIDEELQRVHVLRLGRDRKFKEVRPRKGVITSQVLKGFWFKPEWLWVMPRPKKFLLLNEILGPVM